MSRSNLPTEAELAILNVLWRLGPCTVRQVHEALSARSQTKVAYTTTLKLMQIMQSKGLLIRDESQRSHIYQVSANEENMQGKLLNNLREKAFAGSISKLLTRALSSTPTSREELDQIRSLLDDLEKKS